MLASRAAYELIDRGELELADGSRSARKTLERARRDLLAHRDVEGLERLLGPASRLDDGGDLAHAVRQNLRFLARQAQAPSSPRAAPAPVAKPGGRTFLFGDPRRPRSLAFALVASIATFPLFWFAFLIVYGLGEGPSTQHAERVIIVLAAIPPGVGVVLATVDWLGARRSYAPEARGTLVSREALLSAVAVLVTSGAAIALGVWLWNAFL